MKARIFPFAFASTIVLSLAAPLLAATYNWNGSTTGGATGSSNTWNTVTANWTGTGTIWPTAGTDNDAVFAGTAGNVTISSGVSANDLTFNTANYKIDGGTLTLNGTAQTATNAVTAEIASVLAGTANLTKKSAGVLILSGANSLTGSLIAGIAQSSDPSPSIVNDGILRLAHSKAAGTSTITVNGGYQRGRIELTGGITVSNAITLQGRQGFSYSAITNNGGDNQITGAINAVSNGARLIFNSSAGNLTVSGAAMTGASGRTLTLRGAASGEFAKNITSAVVGNVDKLDAGTWTFSGTNTYAGATTIQGRLIVTNASGLGTGNVSTSAGATLDYISKADSQLAIGGTLTIAGGTNSAIGGSIGSGLTTASINVTGAATITDAAHAVNIHKVLGTDAIAGTYTLISGGAGSVLNPPTTPTLGKVFNNNDFTVGALTRSTTTLDVAISIATPLTTAYWVGGLTDSTNVWAISDGSTASNWSATDGGSVQPLVPGPTTNVVISSSAVTTAPTALVLGANTAVNKLTIADTTNGLGLTADPFTLTIGSGGVTMQPTVPASSIGARVALDADQTWTNDSSNTLTVAGAISGSGALIKNGTGALILSGSNTFSGNTDVDAGVLGLSNVNALAGSVLNRDAADTGTLSYLVTGTSTDSNTYNLGGLSGDGILNAGGKTLSIGAKNQATEFSGVLSDGALTKVGSNTLTLSGDNNFSGNVTVSSGRLTLAHSNALGTGPKTLFLQGTGRTVYLRGGITIPSNITFHASTNSGDGGGINNESGTNEIAGPVVITFGNSVLNISSADGALALSGGITSNTAGRSLILGGASTASNTVSGAISNGSTTNLPVTKQGTGKWILTNTNTYTGTTTISDGTLLVNGSTAVASAVAVNGGVLGGTGTVNGPVTVGATGTVAPGASTGTLAAGSADFSAGGTLAIEINDSYTPKVDVLNVTGNLNVTDAKLTILPTGTPAQSSYVIATAGSITGTFPPANVTGIPAGYTLEYTATEIKLTASSSPFSNWMSTNFPAITAPNNDPDDDPDGDGVNNLAEFAFSGDPGNGSNNGLQRSGIDNVGGTDHLTYTFACRSGAIFTGSGPANASQDGVDYSVRGSLDLSAFTLGVNEVSPAIITGLGTAPAGYTYRTFRVTDPKTTNPKAFIQVKTSPTAP